MSLTVRDGRFFSGKNIPIWYDALVSFQDTVNTAERFKLILIESGAGIMTIGGRKLAFAAPILLCLNERENVEMALNSNVKAKAFYFHPQFVNRILTLEKLRSGYNDQCETDIMDICLLRPFLERNDVFLGQCDIVPSTLNRITDLFDGIRREMAEQSCKYWPCRVRSYLFELLLLLERLFVPDEVKAIKPLGRPNVDMGRVLLYLHIHYRHKVTIPDLCAAFHMNKTTLQKQFQAAAGISVLSYLIRLRIKLSTVFLKNTSLPIYEIVGQLGFSDNAHFTKMFRKHFGCTPNEYRKRHFSVMK